MELQGLTLAYEALIEQVEEFDFEQMKCKLTWFEETIPGYEEEGENIPKQGSLIMVYRGSPETAAFLKAFINSVIEN